MGGCHEIQFMIVTHCLYGQTPSRTKPPHLNVTGWTIVTYIYLSFSTKTKQLGHIYCNYLFQYFHWCKLWLTAWRVYILHCGTDFGDFNVHLYIKSKYSGNGINSIKWCRRNRLNRLRWTLRFTEHWIGPMLSPYLATLLWKYQISRIWYQPSLLLILFTYHIIFGVKKFKIK